MADHTPLPWEQSGRMIYSPGENGGNVCEISEPRASKWVEHTPVELGSKDSQEAYCNARLIVRAVNSYDELLEAAKFAARIVEISPVDNAIPAYQALVAAINKAEGNA